MLPNILLSSIFLKSISLGKGNKSKNKQTDYIKLKGFFKARDTISKINNGSTQKIRSLYKGPYPIRDNSKYKNKL